jgi:hypothetical protein
MALNGKGGSRPSAGGGRFAGQAFSPASSARPVVETYGRMRPPPKPGSSYSEFEYWATSGHWPMKEDVDLAVRLWSSPPPALDDDEPAAAPGLR